MEAEAEAEPDVSVSLCDWLTCKFGDQFVFLKCN